MLHIERVCLYFSGVLPWMAFVSLHQILNICVAGYIFSKVAAEVPHHSACIPAM